jgi:hypothetical protein
MKRWKFLNEMRFWSAPPPPVHLRVAQHSQDENLTVTLTLIPLPLPMTLTPRVAQNSQDADMALPVFRPHGADLPSSWPVGGVSQLVRPVPIKILDFLGWPYQKLEAPKRQKIHTKTKRQKKAQDQKTTTSDFRLSRGRRHKDPEGPHTHTHTPNRKEKKKKRKKEIGPVRYFKLGHTPLDEVKSSPFLMMSG